MFDLFGDEVATPLAGLDLQSTPLPRAEVLAWEKELLGVWLSEHPFTHAAPKLSPHVTALCNELTPELLQDLPAQGRDLIIAGIVGSTRRLTTRDGRGFIAAEVQDLSGTLEVTVWPDVYEMTTDLWLAGSIVMLKVRLRERGDRLTAGVQEVVGFTEDFEPPAWASPEALAESAPGPRRNGNGYANGGNGNGHSNGGNGNSHVTEVPPLPAVLEEPPSVPSFEPPAPIAEPAAEVLPPPPAMPDPAPVHETEVAPPLRLVLRESADEDADQKRLATVFRLLQAQPGSDRVLLTIHTRDGDTIDLALPTAKLDTGLRASLEEAVSGSEAIPAG
jgi:DNA polymerase-3 subunit alpha